MAGLAVVTGASSGIGEAYALELARRGEYDLVLAARRVDRLEELAQKIRKLFQAHNVSRSVTVLPVDLSEAASRAAFAEKLKALGSPVEILINNAGFGSIGAFHLQQREAEMVEVNCVASVDLTARIMPEMVARGRGQIIFVSSVAAFQPMPYFSTYAATKAFLLGFSVALRAEYFKSGVKISALCPGPTESEFHLVAGLRQKIDMMPAMSAERVVRESLDGVSRAYVVPGLRNKILSTVGRILPLRMSAQVSKLILSQFANK